MREGGGSEDRGGLVRVTEQRVGKGDISDLRQDLYKVDDWDSYETNHDSLSRKIRKFEKLATHNYLIGQLQPRE